MQFLERSNVAFEKEIGDLKAELQRYTTALQHHEPQCSLHSQSRLAGHVTPQVKALSSTSTTISLSALNVDTAPVTSAQSSTARPGETQREFSLSELLDSADWTSPWDLGHWSLH